MPQAEVTRADSLMPELDLQASAVTDMGVLERVKRRVNPRFYSECACINRR